MIKINFQNNITKANADTFNTMQDNIEDAINNVSINLDDEVSTSSTNGVENQAITNYVDNKILNTYSTSNTNTYSCDYINNNSGGIETYSTSETLTNKVWIDGKPIYRKVLNIGAKTYTSGNNNIAHNISNIDKVISINFKVYAYSSWYEKWDNINNVIATSTNFNIHINNQFDADDGFAIIEYTKANS